MRLPSTDHGFQLEIVRNAADDVHSDYTIRAEVTTSFGKFSGENTAIHLSGFSTFLKQFDEFLKTRRGEVVLQMTEDNALTFFRWNKKGDVGVRFTLCRYAYIGEPAKTSPVVFKGEFPLDGEFLTPLQSELVTLADREHA